MFSDRTLADGAGSSCCETYWPIDEGIYRLLSAEALIVFYINA